MQTESLLLDLIYVLLEWNAKGFWLRKKTIKEKLNISKSALDHMTSV